MSDAVFAITDPNSEYLKMGDRNSSDVKRLQEILNSLGYDCGAADGIFGKLTYEAVTGFQRDYGLKADGIVGSNTVNKINEVLSGKANKQEHIGLGGSINKAINITASFEGSGYTNITGNFDGMGMSLGILQWNIGQGTLQPLFNELLSRHDDLARRIFVENYGELANILKQNQQKQLQWAILINDANNRIKENWRSQFIELCKTSEFQAIQLNKMQPYINMAHKICEEYGLKTERALALGFDIAVQNGSIKQQAREQISKNSASRNISEKELIAVIADAVANAANPKWRDDVLSRKMTIVNGAGIVHKTKYDLEKQFGLTDALFA